jgi:Ni/Co efflux regulator RcnB
MRHFFPLLIVCAVIATGGCAHQRDSSAQDRRAEAKERRAEAKQQRAEAKQQRAEARGQRTDGEVVMSENGRVEGRVYGSPARGSKFTNLRIGMSKARVDSMIGQGSDVKGYTTGKAFIPFYHGRDSYRLEYFYKGSGRLAFSAGGLLVSIVHDANEDGYKD